MRLEMPYFTRLKYAADCICQVNVYFNFLIYQQRHRYNTSTRIQCWILETLVGVYTKFSYVLTDMIIMLYYVYNIVRRTSVTAALKPVS